MMDASAGRLIADRGPPETKAEGFYTSLGSIADDIHIADCPCGRVMLM